MHAPHRIQAITRKAAPVLRRNGVVRAGIFGSVVRGEDNRKSDIDFLIQFKGRKSLLDVVRLKRELEEVLKKHVDLVEYSAVKPRLRRAILSEEVKIA